MARSPTSPADSPRSSRLLELPLRLGTFLLPYAEDLGALALGALALLTVLGLLQLTGGDLVQGWVAFLRRWMGWGAWAIPMTLLAAAFGLGRRRLGLAVSIAWHRVVALEVALLGLLGAMSLAGGGLLTRAEAGLEGGLVGWGLATLATEFLGTLGAWALFLVALGVGLLLGVPRSLLRRFAHRPRTYREGAPPRAGSGAAVPAESPEPTPSRKRRSTPIPREFRKNFKLPARPEETASRPLERDERLPPLDLLQEGRWQRTSVREINRAAALIEKTLADFGLPVRVVDFQTGPTVTQFAVEPGYIEQEGPEGVRRQKVRVSQIAALAKDLALALSAPRVRVQAPVPGRSYVGVEVPNQRKALVRLRPILESEAFQRINSPLAIALGRDVAGVPVAADLAAMPHLLIAGTTGSGKSVCITALATCLVMNNTPDDLRLVMVDPKMVELLRFNGLPHLYGKVETELERIVAVLRWCTQEMDRRYRLLEEARARDLATYNQRMRRRKGGERLPRLVVIIDELADLMMMAPDQTEHTLVRLAQMGRATGVHLVVATQRPSTDIVTGLIKANFPARISFAVASSTDSRVVLDTAGAETLLGRGDMLYLSPEAAAPVRLQGVFVGDEEVERVVDYWRQVREDQPSEPAPWEDLIRRQREAGDREEDEILQQAIEVVREAGEASASLLQRRLRIGYPRAARLMDQLEELGVIGRSQGGGRTREVLIDREPDSEEDL